MARFGWEQRRAEIRGRGGREGFFLLMVLVVVAVATLAVYSFTETMIVMDDAVHLESGLAQSTAAVHSAGSVMRVTLSQPRQQIDAAGGLYNNPNLFGRQWVAAESIGGPAVGFSVMATGIDEMGNAAGVRYGLTDLSGRLNVNSLIALDQNSELIWESMTSGGDENEAAMVGENVAVSMLMTLPSMTPEIADAILDWIDEDDDPRDLGAELETYAVLASPYEPANGPIDAIDDLLLVRGVTPTLLYGVDDNRNGVIDADEQLRSGVTVDTPGALGWASMMTAVSAESTIAPSGLPRVDVNAEDLEALLPRCNAVIDNPAVASFVVAFRVSGQAAGEVRPNLGDSLGGPAATVISGGLWDGSAIGSIDLTGGGEPIGQLLDLVGATVTVSDGGNQTQYDSPIPADPVLAAPLLASLFDAVMATGVEPLPGRLNVNVCPPAMLSALPVLSVDQIDEIVRVRDPMSTDPIRRHAVWLWTEGIVSLEQMRALSPILCGGGGVFEAQTIASEFGGGAFARWRIILDATESPPRIIGRQNLTHLGRGFDLSVLGMAAVPSSP